MNVAIISATHDHKKAVAALHRADAAAKGIWTSGIDQTWYWYWASTAKQEHWDLAFIGEELVGSVHWSVRRDGWKNLRDLTVHPSHRGRGLGRHLVEYVGLPVFLKTDVNSAANKFYLHLGFRHVGTCTSRNGAKEFAMYELSGTIPEQPA